MISLCNVNVMGKLVYFVRQRGRKTAKKRQNNWRNVELCLQKMLFWLSPSGTKTQAKTLALFVPPFVPFFVQLSAIFGRPAFSYFKMFPHPPTNRWEGKFQRKGSIAENGSQKFYTCFVLCKTTLGG